MLKPHAGNERKKKKNENDSPAGGEAGGDIKNCLKGAGGCKLRLPIGVTG